MRETCLPPPPPYAPASHYAYVTPEAMSLKCIHALPGRRDAWTRPLRPAARVPQHVVPCMRMYMSHMAYTRRPPQKSRSNIRSFRVRKGESIRLPPMMAAAAAASQQAVLNRNILARFLAFMWVFACLCGSVCVRLVLLARTLAHMFCSVSRLYVHLIVLARVFC